MPARLPAIALSVTAVGGVERIQRVQGGGFSAATWLAGAAREVEHEHHVRRRACAARLAR